jgi:hypothetical protein
MEEEFADDEAVTHSSRLFRELTAEERELLQEMRQWADGASKRPDAKARELLNWIHTYIQPNGVV